jgi:hypothetical protein
MARKTQEDIEIESLIRGQAIQAQQWQAQITKDEDLEMWMASGNWDFLKQKVLDEIEREAFATIKNPDFNPSDVAQVAQLKALCQTIDLIKGKIDQRLAMVTDARTKLRELEISTPKEGE